MELNGAEIENYKKVCFNRREENKTEKNFRITIPFYQRPYLWGSKEINLLIDDYYKSIKNTKTDLESSEKQYFTGAIVTVYNLDENINEFHEIVDGQQRLTTIFLINYLKYLILRKRVYLILSNRKVTGVEKLKEKFVSTYKNLFLNYQDFTAKITNLLESYLKVFDNCESTEEQNLEFKKICEEYSALVKIEMDNITSRDYIETSVDLNKELLNEQKLSLNYSRKSYNKNLKDMLSNVDIKIGSQVAPIIEFSKSINGNKLEDKHPYINAIVEIFNNIKNRTNSKNSLKQAKEMIENLDELLNNLEFCIVQTNNTRDAYTLFEVLNDRGLALTSLDLIKNMYYKSYCENNKNLSDRKIDKKIAILENLWGEETFSNDIADYKKDLILYFGTIFLTGNSNLKYKNNKSYIAPLSKTLKKCDYKEIQYHFVVFNVCKIIINQFDIIYKNKNKKVLLSETSTSTSIIIKTLHLNNALGQVGIISSLISVIIGEYKDLINDFNIKTYKIKFKNFLKKIENKYCSFNDNEKENYKKIYKISENIRKLTLLSKGYEITKNYSDKIISLYYKEDKINNIDITTSNMKKAKKSFREWTDKWEKGSKNSDLKVKILFINLFFIHFEDGCLKRKGANNISYNNPTKLELDHFEPENITNIRNKSNYFTTEIDNRERYINQIGNFILLEKKENISKSNTPAKNAMKYYKKMGINDHWITKELYSLFKKYNENNVPTKEFFNIRKNKLINYFEKLLDLEISEEIKTIDVK